MSEEQDEEEKKGSHNEEVERDGNNEGKKIGTNEERRESLKERRVSLKESGDRVDNSAIINSENDAPPTDAEGDRVDNSAIMNSENDAPSTDAEGDVMNEERARKNELLADNSTKVGDEEEDYVDDDDDGSVAEKELLYLKFIQDVTTALLSTGRISERILTEIFKRHVEEYGEEKISAEKADELLRQLRKDLGFLGNEDVEAGLTKRLVRDIEEMVAKGGEEDEGKADRVRESSEGPV